jgi:hypothetical protein
MLLNMVTNHFDRNLRDGPGLTKSAIGLLALSVLGLSLPFSGGCQRGAKLTLHQPFAPPAQQELHLASQWAFYEVDGARRNCLIAFPLPLSATGPRDFLVYLTGPDALGSLPIGGPDGDMSSTLSGPDSGPAAPSGGAADASPASRPTEHAVRGFLIQAAGSLAGKTVFASGVIRVSAPLLKPRCPRIELDIHCQDGTTLTGAADLQPAPHELRGFQRRYAADIAQLSPVAGQVMQAAGSTTSRPASTGY